MRARELWIVLLLPELGWAEGDGTTKSNWTVQSEKSPIDDSTTVLVYTEAAAEIAGWPDQRFRPRLVVRHKEAVVEAYVVTGMAAAIEDEPGKAMCTIRFDDEKAITIGLRQATSEDALFFDSKRWIKQMLKSKRLVFRFTPFKSAPQTSVFDLAGLEDAIKPVEQASGWKVGSLEDRLGDALSTKAVVAAGIGYVSMTEIGDMDLTLRLSDKALDEYAPLRTLAIECVMKAVAETLADGSVVHDLPANLRVSISVQKEALASFSNLKSEFMSAAKKSGIADRLEFRVEEAWDAPQVEIRLVLPEVAR